ncbi:MAG: hypothetical protein ILA30_02390, partial [Selenomonas sp.]|nr:hypothetical protein [Selenomonas sp.]
MQDEIIFDDSNGSGAGDGTLGAGMNMPKAEAAAEGHKILVAYFSHSGTTQRVAERIQQETGGTLFAIQPSVPYPSEYQ